MLPPPAPTFASAGIVVSALFGGAKRRPRTLICPSAGVTNSIVPRRSAVFGYLADSTKDVWPSPLSEIVLELSATMFPLSSRIITGMLAFCAETFSTATPRVAPPVLSKASK